MGDGRELAWFRDGGLTLQERRLATGWRASDQQRLQLRIQTVEILQADPVAPVILIHQTQQFPTLIRAVSDGISDTAKQHSAIALAAGQRVQPLRDA